MDVALRSALADPTPTVVTLVRLALRGGPVICWVKEGGETRFDGETYIGRDEVFGVVSKIETPSDGADGQASRCAITVLPASDAGLVQLTAPTAQGSHVEIWTSALNRTTGLPIGEELEPLFIGELDYGDMSVAGSRSLVLDCGTEEGRQLEPNAERRLSHSFHQSVWPGEMGLEYVTKIKQKVWWRTKEPSSSGSTARNGTNLFKTGLSRGAG